jgi:hypothetical protein
MRRQLERQERIYIDLQTSARLGKPVSEAAYVDALNLVRTRIKSPLITSPARDFVRAWSQPEARRLFAAWNAAGADDPAFQGTKAVMAWWAGGRLTPHMKYAHDSLIHNSTLLEHFGRLSRMTPAGALLSLDEPAMTVREYSTCTRHKEALAKALLPIAQTFLIEIARSAAELCPDVSLFRWATFDGNMIPAWTRQKEREAQRRSRPGD